MVSFWTKLLITALTNLRLSSPSEDSEKNKQMLLFDFIHRNIYHIFVCHGDGNISHHVSVVTYLTLKFDFINLWRIFKTC